jgi:spoIIIJ-associated protein
MSENEETVEIVETISAAPVIPPESLNEDQQIAFVLVQEFCEASALGAHAVVRSVQKPYIGIELMGGDIRLTLGRSGQGLDALQFLLNTVLMRRTNSDVRLLLDAEGYRERRADALRQRALDLAEEVKKRREEAELEPLPAHERRIIHAALADDPDISTYSEGDEPARRVVIAPKSA